MAKLATITQLSPTMKEGVFVEWVKKEGDAVKPGDVIAAIETDKAVMDLEAFDAGTLLKQLAQKGDKLLVGAPVAVIGQPGEDYSALLAGAAKGATVPAPAAPSAAEKELPSEAKTEAKTLAPPEAPVHSGRIKASPLAKKLASQNGIDLAQVNGSGPQGRIVSRDLQSAPTLRRNLPSGARQANTKVAMTPMRQRIAARLSESKQTVPHFYLSRTVNLSSLVKLRADINAGLTKLHAAGGAEHLPLKVSINDFIIAAVAATLPAHPAVMRQFAGDHFVQLGNADVGFAVSLEDGLITPIIRNADQLTLFDIAAASADLAARARARKLKPEEYTGGTFTISNLGMMGITSFQAIINAPEAAILAVGASERRAVEGKDGSIGFAEMLTLNLACDHRVVDGAAGAAFLADLAIYLENPGVIR
jgi:pyruvate dehydrogenase E2 component (dihydrolipoamide acetyltransferase)